MANKEKFIDGDRQTWVFLGEVGKYNRKYAWDIRQNNNGAVVKFTDEQMKELVNTYLDWMGYDLI